jgi:hypothetical protein
MYYKLKEKDSVIPKTKGPVDAIVYVQFNLSMCKQFNTKLHTVESKSNASKGALSFIFVTVTCFKFFT